MLCAALAAELLGIISDLDRLLATNPNYLLGTWYAGTFRLVPRSITCV